MEHETVGQQLDVGIPEQAGLDASADPRRHQLVRRQLRLLDVLAILARQRHRRPVGQDRRVAMPIDHAAVRVERGVEPAERLRAVAARLELAAKPLHHEHQRKKQDVFLGLGVLIDQARADAGLARDLLDRRPIEPLDREELDGGGDDLFAPPLDQRDVGDLALDDGRVERPGDRGRGLLFHGCSILVPGCDVTESTRQLPAGPAGASRDRSRSAGRARRSAPIPARTRASA